MRIGLHCLPTPHDDAPGSVYLQTIKEDSEDETIFVIPGRYCPLSDNDNGADRRQSDRVSSFLSKHRCACLSTINSRSS